MIKWQWQLPVQVASLNQRLTATRLGSGTHVLCAISTGSTQPKSCKIDELVKRQRTVEISSWFLVLSPYPSTSPSSTFLLQEMHLGLFPISITSCLTINTIFYLSFIATITISFFPPFSIAFSVCISNSICICGTRDSCLSIASSL